MSWLRFYELDDIISGLRYEDGHYDLICLDDKEYITKLNALYSYWKKLKEEIENVRLYGYENTDIVEMSETYFGLADEMVNAAEQYSEGIANQIRWLQIFSAIDMIALVGMLVEQTLSAIKISGKNKMLDWFNKCGKSVKVSYAQGAAYSSDYKDCTLRTLFDKADKFMYDNKLRSKMSRENTEKG